MRQAGTLSALGPHGAKGELARNMEKEEAGIVEALFSLYQAWLNVSPLQ